MKLSVSDDLVMLHEPWSLSEGHIMLGQSEVLLGLLELVIGLDDVIEAPL